MKKIKEVSRIAGISKRALQYYDERGIVSVRRDEENHRVYDADSMQKVWEIMICKEMGFELEEIGQLVLMKEGERRAYLDRKIREITEEVTHLNMQAGLIRTVLHDGIPPKPEDDVSVSYAERIRQIKKSIFEQGVIQAENRKEI